MKDKRLIIRDVAQAAGVSTQTVSRVINERPDVSDETRTHVQQVITELGYSSNLLARNLSRGQTSTIGDWNAAGGKVGMQIVITDTPDIDAVFVSNEQMALGALQTAHRLGL
jgi:DNA-binding LacI/PurR family transcriptional regulator